ncbi:MAG TPA: response regulator [Polyangia bacterium]
MSEPTLLVVASPYESAMLRRAAERAGVSVREADLEDAEEALAEACPDVMVLAATTATGDGLALAGRLRERPGAAGPHVILLGGGSGPVRSLEEARAHGADDFLARPVDLQLLVAKVLAAAGCEGLAPPVSSLPDLGPTVTARIDAALEGALGLALDAVAPQPAETEVAPAPVPGPVAAPAPAPEPAIVEAAPERPALDAEALARLRVRLDAQVALVLEGDYYAVLGVPRDAGAAVIAQAHAVARRELDPAALGELGDERAAELAAIRVVLDEALRVLGDEGVRAAYRAHLAAAGADLG